MVSVLAFAIVVPMSVAYLYSFVINLHSVTLTWSDIIIAVTLKYLRTSQSKVIVSVDLPSTCNPIHLYILVKALYKKIWYIPRYSLHVIYSSILTPWHIYENISTHTNPYLILTMMKRHYLIVPIMNLLRIRLWK